MRTTSGRRSRASLDRLRAVGRLADDRRCRPRRRGSSGTRSARAAWSSTTRTASRVIAQAGAPCTAKPPPVRGPTLQLAAEELDPLAHARASPLPSVAADGRAAAVVDAPRARGPPASYRSVHVGARRSGVLERVGERLLHDAVGRRGRRPTGSGAHARPRCSAAPAGRRRGPGRRARRRRSRLGCGDELVDGRRCAARRGCGAARRAPARPVVSIDSSVPRGLRPAARRCTRRPAPACTTITLTWWATTSCSSRAMRPRSTATARRASSSRCRSSAAARSSRPAT